MTIPTDPIGSIPRSEVLMEARKAYDAGYMAEAKYPALCDEWLRDTIRRFEETGSPVITDGEQTDETWKGGRYGQLLRHARRRPVCL